MPGPITKEHVWPQWLNGGVEVEATRSLRTLGFERTAHDAFTELPTTTVTKQGSVFTSKVREVCRTCNNEWMSRLETAARPLLQRLWTPAYALGWTTVSPGDASIVAAWATKTAWMHERATDPDPTPTPEMRTHLKDTRLPPELTSVWAGRSVEQEDFFARFSRVTVHHRDAAWDSQERRHVVMCALAFRGLVLLVRTDDGPGVPKIQLPATHWRSLWPAAETVLWPPMQRIVDQELTQIVANLSSWLRLPDVPLFHRSQGSVKLGRQRET